MPTPASTRARRSRVRLSSAERREQLLTISREVFAERGFEGASVEEIAARAGVSKPVVYEHFGGKEGAYQAVVERETSTLHAEIRAALNKPGAGPRETLERGALALLDYIDRCPDGFRILSRDRLIRLHPQRDRHPGGGDPGGRVLPPGSRPPVRAPVRPGPGGAGRNDWPTVAGRSRTGAAGGGPAPYQPGLERNGQPEGQAEASR